MKITQNPFTILPPAINHVKKDLNPTLATATAEDWEKSKNSPRQDVVDMPVLQSIDAWDNPFSEEDALAKQWHKENGWDENGNLKSLGFFGKTDSPELKAYQEQLRLEGFLGETSIDWKDLEFDLRSIGDYDVDKFETKVEYLASRYAAVLSKIESNYSGEEQKNQLNKLEEVFQNSVADMAKNYSRELGNFFDENGIPGENQKIYDSIVSGVNSKADEYKEYIAKNKDYTGLKNSPDKWLANDDEYLAARLREAKSASTAAPAPKTSENNQSELYSINDLYVSTKIIQQLEIHEASASHASDEESTGLDLAVLTMKVDTLAKTKGVGSKMSALLQKTMSGYVDNYFNKVSDKLSYDSSHPLIPEDKKGFAPFSKEDAYSVYSKAMISYSDTGDFLKAILSGAEYGKNQFNQKVSSGEFEDAYRYGGGKIPFWNKFYSVSSSDSLSNMYQKSTSTLQRYKNNWDAFTDSLSGSASDINLYISSSGHSIDAKVPGVFYNYFWSAYA